MTVAMTVAMMFYVNYCVGWRVFDTLRPLKGRNRRQNPHKSERTDTDYVNTISSDIAFAQKENYEK